MEDYFKSNTKPYSSLSPIINHILTTSKNKILHAYLEQKLKRQRKLKIRRKLSINIKKTELLDQYPQENILDQSKSSRYIDEKDKLKLLKKLQKEKQELQHKMQQDLEVKSKKLLEAYELEQKANLQLKEQQKQAKLKQIFEQHEKFIQQKRERQEVFEKSNQDLRKISSVKPLYREFEERYSLCIELPELENRKKELAKRRQLFVPISTKDISMHKKNYEKTLEEKEAKRKEKLAGMKKDDQIYAGNMNFYKAKIYDVAKQADKEQAEILENREKTRKKLVEKSRQYGEIVYEIYRPVVKVEKSIEKNEKGIEKSDKKIEKYKKRVEEKESKSVGKSFSQPELQQEEEEGMQKRYFKKKVHKDDEKNGVSVRTGSTNIRVPRKLSADMPIKDNSFDYLAYKRKIKADNPIRKSIKEDEWKVIVEDASISPKDKLKLMESQMKKLDNQARSYEVFAGVNDSITNISNLNMSYLNSIKAKIAYLNQLAMD
ncbi:hypothetical protein SteCoe_22899 [Stentor coeruleus]|uniref:Uncharacterized protein n=1 Tax=Stentor coeruleus TaxID=5963 RepID=A0A1R2BL68_9CILI|nr:hypothetical protein SteCoe_22899 [Stentor coeruleus]